MTVKSIHIKNHSYYFFNDMINLKIFYSNLLKLGKNSYKNIGIYCTGYITTKRTDDYESIYSVNPLYLIIHRANLVFSSTNEKEKVLAKYEELWNKIKYLIKTINGEKRK